jgi:vancomycin resistance protein VanJ
MSRPQRVAIAVAILYVLALIVVAATFRFVGERWWVATAALYLPRVGFAAPLPLVLLGLAIARLRGVLWLTLAASLALLLVLMGFVVPWPTSVDRGAPIVRVLSFNCNSGNGGLGALVEEVDRFSPDIVLLQELGPPEGIGALMQARYPTVWSSTQFLVASRFPISSSFDPPKLPYGDQLRSARWLQQVIETPLGPIVVYNVHPISPRDGLFAIRGNGGLKREILSGRVLSSSHSNPIQRNAGLRALQVQDFADAARSEKGPVIIAGDTNLPGLSFVLHHDLSGFQDGFAEAGWGFGYTFPTTHMAWMRIDRILASDELRFVRFEVGSSLVSDHHCVVADLQRRSP